MLKEKIAQDLKEALKKGDAVWVSTLRLLSSALHNEEIAKQKELMAEEELVVVRRELKKREEAAEAYEKGGRPESAEKEKKEAGILKEFLLASPSLGGPAQMSEEELGKIVEQIIAEIGASSPSDFGKVMGAIIARVKGQADGKTVAESVRKKLNR